MADATSALAAIAAAYADPDAVAVRLAAAGHRVVRTIGSDAPLTWLRAAELAPVRMVPTGAAQTSRADAIIGAAASRERHHRILECLLDPDQRAAHVLITHADAEQPQVFATLRELRRLGEDVPANVAMLDLVHQPRASSHAYNRARLAQLGPWLEAAGGMLPDDAAIAAAAAKERVLQQRIAALHALRGDSAPRVSGTTILQIIGAAAILPPDDMIGLCDAVLADAMTLAPRMGRRLWLVGSAPEDTSQYRKLEQDGATIVGETHDWGWPRMVACPPANFDEVASPTHQAPQFTRSPAAIAGEAAAAAGTVRADAMIVLRLDHDEVPPWLPAALAECIPTMPVETLTEPEPVSIVVYAPRPRAVAPERSIKVLQAASDFGAYQRHWFASIRRQAADGAPFAVVNANAPQEVLRAAGVPFVVNQWWASIVAAKQQTGRYRRLLGGHGYPVDVEAYSCQALAAALDDDDALSPWGGLPQADFVQAMISTDATSAIFDAMARQNGASVYLYERTVDPRDPIETEWWAQMPDRWDTALDPDRLNLMVAELEQNIAVLEQATGQRFDRMVFAQVMDLVNEQEDYYRRTRNLIAAAKPAPVGIVDTMPATMVPQWHRGTEWARDAARKFHDEVAARVAAGAGVVEHEQARLMWVGRGLWSDMTFYQQWEASHGAVFVWSMYLALAADGYIRRHDHGRDPLRALAARFLTMGDELRMPGWAGPWHVHEAHTHRIDGAVALDDADPFVLRALAAAGIPVLALGIDNYALDQQDQSAIMHKVTAFIEGRVAARAATRLARDRDGSAHGA